MAFRKRVALSTPAPSLAWYVRWALTPLWAAFNAVERARKTAAIWIEAKSSTRISGIITASSTGLAPRSRSPAARWRRTAVTARRHLRYAARLTAVT